MSLTNLSAEALTIHLRSQDAVPLLHSKPYSNTVRLTQALLHRVVGVALRAAAMMEEDLRQQHLEDVAKNWEDIPAGGAVFHRSEMSMSFGFSNRATTASWYNQESKQSLSNVKIPQIGFISSYYNPTTGNGFSFGISRNRVVSYDRDFEAETNPKGTLLDYNGVKGIPFSIADYTAMITPDDLRYDSFYDPQKGGLYDANASWMTILGYEAGFINPGAGGAGPYTTNFYYPDGSGSKVPFGPKRATLRMQERGAVNAYDFNLGYNWGDRCYLGASLKYTSVEGKNS